MKSIQELSALVSDELGRIEYPKNPSLLYEPIDYILALGGKRMRPILVLMAHQLFDKNIEKAISGNGVKEVSSSERKNINIARKSIHLSRDLKSGSVITEKDIISLRPGDGICAMNWEKIIGKTVNTDIKKFTKLTWEDIL